MSGDLAFILELQKHDSALDEMVENVNALAEKIKANNDQISSLKNRLTSAKDTLKALQAKKKAWELEASSKEELIQKHQKELNSLKSNDAYKAMLGEIDAAKGALTKFEDDILETMESIENGEKDLKEKEQTVKADEGVIKGAIQKLESEKTQIQNVEKTKREEREKFAQTVPEKVRSYYQSLREKRAGVAIVPVINNTCSGCGMNLTQNQIVDIKKAKKMVLCESCSRILYFPPPNTPAEKNPTESKTVPTS